jgi:hypothetical protein
VIAPTPSLISMVDFDHQLRVEGVKSSCMYMHITCILIVVAASISSLLQSQVTLLYVASSKAIHIYIYIYIYIYISYYKEATELMKNIME